MKRFAAILLLMSLFATSLLAACDPPLTQGYVYNKQYYQEWVQIVPGHESESCEKVGKSEECDSYWTPAYTIIHPAEYYLDLTTCDTLQTDGQCRTGWVDVDAETYSRYRIGQFYNG